jgi:hypothetical protein
MESLSTMKHSKKRTWKQYWNGAQQAWRWSHASVPGVRVPGSSSEAAGSSGWHVVCMQHHETSSLPVVDAPHHSCANLGICPGSGLHAAVDGLLRLSQASWPAHICTTYQVTGNGILPSPAPACSSSSHYQQLLLPPSPAGTQSMTC